MELKIYIEIEGQQVYVGTISGSSSKDASFKYNLDYLANENSRAISINLPLKEEYFSPLETKTFFEGLLPEGFTRHTLAGWLRVDENDYIELLSKLGKECLGAIKITNDEDDIGEAYEALTTNDIYALAREGTSKAADLVIQAHLSLAGATGKTGLMLSDGKWYLPKGSAPSSHIIKQSHVRFDSLIVNEQLCQIAAKQLGINAAESFVINLGKGNDNDILFATKRYDRSFIDSTRLIDGVLRPFRLHQEDFAQAMGIEAKNKYEKFPDENYLARTFELIREHSYNPIEDQIEMWKRVTFCYLVGNTDCHIKNASLLYSPDLRRVKLAPCYDLVSTTVYGQAKRAMAFSINGKYNISDITKVDLTIAAEACKLSSKLAIKVLDELADSFENTLKNVATQLVDEGLPTATEVCNRILMESPIRNL